MNNAKTTIAGYILVAVAVLNVVAVVLTKGLGGVDWGTAIQSILAALGGVGLVAAKDGGH